MTTETATGSEIRSEEMDSETERIVLDRLASFDEDAKTAVDAHEALAAIRRNLKAASSATR